MIAIDTGPLVAFFDREDDRHQACVAISKEVRKPFVSTWPVISEAFYLLGFSYRAQDDLWEFIIRGLITIRDIDPSSYLRCRELMKKYNDLPMDLADATLVTVAEAEGIPTIFTLDHKDFRVYKTRHGKHFKLLPSKL
jgi:predicted nucleic acid-binding protein